jgi:arylsulfatase A-like enzyme
MKVSRRQLLGSAAAMAALPFSSARASDNGRIARPNIVFIMADDLGYADLGCYGARTIRTPCLDSLAAQGVRLVNGYSNSPVCSATRTALITGRYQYRLPCGLEEPIFGEEIGLPATEPTLPKALKELGYRTALVGKWHLGELPKYSPLTSGYDRFFGIEGGGADYFSHTLDHETGERKGLLEGKTPVERAGYLTDLFGDRAVKELQEAVDAGTPIFLSLHFTAPHWPWEGPDDSAVSRRLDDPLHTNGGNLKTYAKMVESMDYNISKVLAALNQLGIADETVVIFTSDNGGERFSDVWPFTGAKTELLEGGIRVPIIIRWPGRIPVGHTSDQTMISMDFAPTLIAAAGGSPASIIPFDGENLLPALSGRSPEKERELYWRYRFADQAAVRIGDWKYLKIAGNEYLFNLQEDPRERANLKNEFPTRFECLREKFIQWNSTMLPYPDNSYSHSITNFFADRYMMKNID